MISSTNPTAEYTEMHELVLTTSRIQENAKDTSKALWKDDENKKGFSARVETCFRTSHYLSRGKGGGSGVREFWSCHNKIYLILPKGFVELQWSRLIGSQCSSVPLWYILSATAFPPLYVPLKTMWSSKSSTFSPPPRDRWKLVMKFKS